jgi:hypothetical protein
MIDYRQFGQPAGRPPRRRYKHAAAAAVGAVLAVAVASAILLLGRGAASPMAPGRAVASPVSPAGALTLGACIDPTASIVRSFAPSVRADLAEAVGALAPPPGRLPTNTITGGPVTVPQAGVNLTVRQITTNSYTSNPGPYMAAVTVPGVAGLASRPQPGIQDYVSRLRVWTAGYDSVAAARTAARNAAATGAGAIAGMPLDRKGWSGISACISGLLTTVPASGTHSYLLASDLQEDVTPQLAGSFNGAPLVIIQTCDTGKAAHCQALLDRFTATMRRLGAGRITIIRPEAAAAAIGQWVRTGEVTP